MTLIHRIKQRYIDFIHEGAIRAVQDEIAHLQLNGPYPSGHCWDAYLEINRLDRELASLIAQRSPSQLKRMGVHADKLKLE